MTDPVDLGWALQKAVFQALTAAGVPIADVVDLGENFPDEQVYFGEDAVQELGGKADTLERHDLTIHVMVAGSSREPLRALQAQVKGALHNQPLPAQPGVHLSAPVQQTANGQLTDIATLLGSQTFLIFAQPDL